MPCIGRGYNNILSYMDLVFSRFALRQDDDGPMTVTFLISTLAVPHAATPTIHCTCHRSMMEMVVLFAIAFAIILRLVVG